MPRPTFQHFALGALGAQLLLSLKSSMGSTLAKEGLGALVGVPGLATLAEVLGQSAAGVLVAIQANRWTKALDDKDAGIVNHHFDVAAGRAAARIARDLGARGTGTACQEGALQRVAAWIEKHHSAKLLGRGARTGVVPVTAAKFVEDPQGFLREIALPASVWSLYLEDVERGAALRLGACRAELASALEAGFSEALYKELQIDFATGGQAFAGAVLRMLNVSLGELHALRQEGEANFQALQGAVRALRRDLDPARIGNVLTRLEAIHAELAPSLGALRTTLADLPARLDELLAGVARLEAHARQDRTDFADVKGTLVRIERKVDGPRPAPGPHPTNLREPRTPVRGRDGLLATMRERLGAPAKSARLVLSGPPGIGKSEVARELGRRALPDYPGGVFSIDVRGGGAPTDLLAIGRDHLGWEPDANFKVAEQCTAVLARLGAEPTLLIYDGVTSQTDLEPWLPYASQKCHVVVTTVLDTWDPPGALLDVLPLPEPDLLEVARDHAGAGVPPTDLSALARRARGLVVEVPLAAAALGQAHRHGRPAQGPRLTSASVSSFSGPYELAGKDGQVLLLAAALYRDAQLPREVLEADLTASGALTAAQTESALELCQTLRWFDGSSSLRLHGLYAEFLLAREEAGDHREALGQIRRQQAERFLQLADRVRASPGDADALAAMLRFPLDLESWPAGTRTTLAAATGAIGRALTDGGRFASALPWCLRAAERTRAALGTGGVDSADASYAAHMVGVCLSQLGRYAEALPWFEKAAKDAEQGGVHGRVDHQSLGTSLHQVGYCWSRQGQFARALPWYEKAVKEKEQGDLQGRVNHEVLGTSLHEVGVCWSRQGKHAEALPWFERAVKEKEQGGVHGRVNHQRLGLSLHEVGFCFSERGMYAQARLWFERAVKEKEHGDVHGRLDHQSLGASIHQVGVCLTGQGKHAEALPWFEKAVQEAEQGDVHGRLDHESLGTSLHEVGVCWSRQGKHVEALPWHERAVKEAEQGDVHGRLDHESLAVSLHEVGYCWSQQGKDAQALPWYERAVNHAERGDVHGRVHATLPGVLRRALAACRARLAP